MINEPGIFSRRDLLCAGFAFGCSSCAFAQASQAAAATPSVKFQWAVRSPSADALREDLTALKATLEPGTKPFTPPDDQRQEYADASFAPLVVIAGAVALTVVLEAVLKFYRGVKGPGALIDVRRDPVEIREVPSLPSGTVLVVTRDKPPQLMEVSGGTDVAALLRAMGSAAPSK